MLVIQTGVDVRELERDVKPVVCNITARETRRDVRTAWNRDGMEAGMYNGNEPWRKNKEQSEIKGVDGLTRTLFP